MIFLFIFFLHFLSAEIEKTTYPLTNDPIDVVIPCHKKDLPLLPFCLQGIQENLKNIRRIIVISEERLTHLAEWFDEKDFSFTKKKIADEFFGKKSIQSDDFIKDPTSNVHWIYPKLLKLYAPFVIPKLSPNVLVLDVDVIFLQPTSLMTSKGLPRLTPSKKKYSERFIEFAEKLIPTLSKNPKNLSGLSHHILFQKPILNELFRAILQTHHREPWRILSRLIGPHQSSPSSFSEYGLYYNFVLNSTDQYKLQKHQWKDSVSDIYNLEFYQAKDLAFIVCRDWLNDFINE